jgi:hypothetical protein
MTGRVIKTAFFAEIFFILTQLFFFPILTASSGEFAPKLWGKDLWSRETRIGHGASRTAGMGRQPRKAE